MLAISDHLVNSGGFHCVPGFCQRWQEWAAANRRHASSSGLVPMPAADAVRQHLQRIPLRPGSAVLCRAGSRKRGKFTTRDGRWE